MKNKLIDICWFIWDWIAFLAIMPFVFLLYLYYRLDHKIDEFKKKAYRHH